MSVKDPTSHSILMHSCLICQSMISWWDIYITDDVEQAVYLFSDRFIGLLDIHAPLKTIQTQTNYVPWLSAETKHLMKMRNEAQSLAASSKQEGEVQNFKILPKILLNNSIGPNP